MKRQENYYSKAQKISSMNAEIKVKPVHPANENCQICQQFHWTNEHTFVHVLLAYLAGPV